MILAIDLLYTAAIILRYVPSITYEEADRTIKEYATS
jgi:hypothetical protein